MKIDHLAIWVDDLEVIRTFYMTYFNLTCGEPYHNPTKNFTSYFLKFDDGKTRLELMYRPDVTNPSDQRGFTKGITHFAISVGSKAAVDRLTERLRQACYSIESELRTTGDGYYESVVLDPEGNHIEITA